MSIESLKSFFDLGTLVLAFLTFVFLTGVWITGDIINKQQAGQLRQFDKDLTTAKTELAKQQGATAKAQEMLLAVAKKQAARFIPRKSLSSLLHGKATGTVVKILYQPEDTEAFQFGMSLAIELEEGGWGVDVASGIQPIPADSTMVPPEYRTERTAQIDRMFPAVMRIGGPGLTLVANSIQPDLPKEGAFNVLRTALTSLGFLNGSRRDETLAENSFVLIVGPKP